MVKKATRKTSKASKVLDINSLSKIPALEKLLKGGNITIVLIYADWCGHCHTFKKNIWSPMCNREAKHNRVAVNEKVLNETSLANANIEGYPSVIVVNEEGKAEPFQKPDGQITNAIPTPKSVEDMERIVNTPVTPSSPTTPTIPTVAKEIKTLPFMSPPATPPLISATPQGTVYQPTPMVAPEEEDKKEGNMMKVLQGGSLPTNVLKALSAVMRGGKPRKTQKVRKGRMFRA